MSNTAWVIRLYSNGPPPRTRPSTYLEPVEYDQAGDADVAGDGEHGELPHFEDARPHHVPADSGTIRTGKERRGRWEGCTRGREQGGVRGDEREVGAMWCGVDCGRGIGN